MGSSAAAALRMHQAMQRLVAMLQVCFFCLCDRRLPECSWRTLAWFTDALRVSELTELFSSGLMVIVESDCALAYSSFA